MISITSLLRRLLYSIVIRFRLYVLIISNLPMNIIVNCLRTLYRLFKYVGSYVQLLFDIITEKHYSLFYVSDVDFSIGITAQELFNQNNYYNDYNSPDIHDIFYIYLSKLLYESPDRIIEQYMNWRFDEGSIKLLSYIPSEDIKKYPHSTQAAVINHNESNTIIIAFGETRLMDLLQWGNDASTNVIDINNVFNDNLIRVNAGLYSALGLSAYNPSQPIDFINVTRNSPMFIQLLSLLKKFNRNKKYKISITSHSLGGGLASLFSFVLLAYGYESSISGVYTYSQPLVGNLRYAEILNNKLGNRIHRWVNHCDIVARVPITKLLSIVWCYAGTPYSDVLDVYQIIIKHNQMHPMKIIIIQD